MTPNDNATLTIEDFKKAQLKLTQSAGMLPPSLLYPAPFSCAGMPVIKVPVTAVPKLQLSPGFKGGSKEERSKMDAWLLERFGTRDTTPIPEGLVFMVNNSMLAIRQDNMGILSACEGA